MKNKKCIWNEMKSSNTNSGIRGPPENNVMPLFMLWKIAIEPATDQLARKNCIKDNIYIFF